MESRLYRSKHNRVFLGVCGGIGEYFHIDPVLVRIIAVLLLIPGVFPAIIAYFILALIIPLEGTTTSSTKDSIQENISDMRDTTADFGEEIRHTFGNKETKSDASGQSSNSAPHPYVQSASNRGLYILGIILIVIGIFVVIINFFGWFWRYLWPILLIAAGLAIIISVTRRR